MMQDTGISTMCGIDFKTAEKIIAISQVVGLSPLFVGRNRIGKTTMFEYHVKKNQYARMVKSLNMGGMQRSEEIKQYISQKVNTIFLHDLNRLLSKRFENVSTTFDEIADCIDGKKADIITYHKDDMLNLNVKFNFISAVSPVGFYKLRTNKSTWDYLTRVPIFYINDYQFKPELRAL